MEILSFLVVFSAGFVACFVVEWVIKRRALSLVRQQANAKGQLAKADQAEQLMQFLIEVKTAYDASKASGKDIKGFATQDLPPILMKYPGIVMRFGGKLYGLLKNGGNSEELASLFG